MNNSGNDNARTHTHLWVAQRELAARPRFVSLLNPPTHLLAIFPIPFRYDAITHMPQSNVVTAFWWLAVDSCHNVGLFVVGAI